MNDLYPQLCPECGYRTAETAAKPCTSCVSLGDMHAKSKRNADDLAAYREFLQLPPSEWGGEITGTVCAALGMDYAFASNVAMYKVGGSDIAVDLIGNAPARVYIQGSKGLPWCKTAGQLMFLVAARRLGGG